MNPELQRLAECRAGIPWKVWGPYLSERQWGTVREDYSADGNAWDHFTHDQARYRTYRWGEDGLGGISDEKQRLCLALALWNGADPFLKERLFGLTNSQGNHGEDVKEYYFYLDNTPTHSWMKFLYKYPQAAYPYDDLVRQNRDRGRGALEYELLDTGVFKDDRYFDVFVEYAKAAPEEMLIRITVHNRGPAAALLHLLPTLWFRNTWSRSAGAPRPGLRAVAAPPGRSAVQATHPEIGEWFFVVQGEVPLLFTENESNGLKLEGKPGPSPFVKDAFHEFVVGGKRDAINPARAGTKAAAHFVVSVPAGGSAVMRARLGRAAPDSADGDAFDAVIATRLAEADRFHDAITPPALSADERLVQRQALAGMLWTKQYYWFDLDRWLEEHQAHPLQASRPGVVRNRNWFHMVNDDVISMPDKWEYPWYASWDLAFHTVALNMVDPDFAREQLDLMLHEVYLHPSGQIPAYEWNFSDVNPPVHAWATLFSYATSLQMQGGRNDADDFAFLQSAFQKLLLNFTWWVNRKDPGGRNVFEGGFLGLDNIGVFDRSSPLPTGGYLEQADGTAWMALFSQNMLEMALELGAQDAGYEDMAVKFLEHFLWIAAAMDRIGDNQDELWDETDGFFYDILFFPDGSATRLKVRSVVGLLPLCAVTVLPGDITTRFPRVAERLADFQRRHAELLVNMASPMEEGVDGRRILSVLGEQKLRRVLARMLDEEEFLSPHGIRSLSRVHLDHPYVFQAAGREYRVAYLPAESDNAMFGGNSNWRGPVWMPVNVLIIRALLQYYLFYGDSFTVECPTGSGLRMTLYEVAKEISRRLAAIFLRGPDGRRPVYGATEVFQSDPHWRDLILFYEYFHGDNGAGIGASHQTGWTGVVARLIQLFGHLDAHEALEDAVRPVTTAYWRDLGLGD
jgi:hypothetical protein